MKVHTRRFFAKATATTLAATATLALAACGSASSTESGGDTETTAAAATGSLTVWVDADRARALKDVAAKFEEEKGVDVELVTKDYGEIRDQFTSQVPTGKGPDITIGGHDWIGSFVKDGVVAPVELGDKAKDYEDVAIQAVTYEDNTYGLPYAIENIGILRNTDLVPEAPDSYDDMIAAGEKAGTKYPFVVGLDPQAADPYHLYPFQTSFGNSVFKQNEDGTYDASQLTIGDESGTEFAEWLGSQGDAGTGVFNLNLDGDLAKEAFNAGDSPFFLSGPWNVADAEKAGINVAVDPVPAAGDETAQPFAGVQAFFINAKSENKILANEFLVNYIGTPDVQTSLYEAGGRVPALTEAYDAAQSDPITAGFAKAGENAVPMPSIPEMGSVWDDWGKSETAIIKGEDPEKTWTDMSDSIEKKIAG